MEVSGWLEELGHMRDVWKFVWIEDGVQFVMMLGELWMPVWPADSLDTLDIVSDFCFSVDGFCKHERDGALEA